jgi:hypothetical protein
MVIAELPYGDDGSGCCEASLSFGDDGISGYCEASLSYGDDRSGYCKASCSV